MQQDFHLDRWLVQPSLGTLTDGEATRQLSHKVMAVLLCLAERPGQVVTKEELFEQAWDGAFVTDEALSTVVYELRKALDDDARDPRYVETIRKRGYRLIAPVSPAPTEATPATTPAWRRVAVLAATLTAAVLTAGLLAFSWRPPAESPEPSEPARIRSLAVRPLSTFTDECRQDFFADGLTEMLIADLAYLQLLDVVPDLATRGSTEAGVDASTADAMLEGSVLRSGDRLWIAIQLVDPTDGHILWGGTYERDLVDALDLQLELSHEITEQIALSVALQSGEVAAPADHEDSPTGP